MINQFHIFVETINYGINRRPTKGVKHDGKSVK